MSENLMTVFGFARSTGLSLEQIAVLLAHGSLPFSRAADGKLLIEATAVDTHSLATSLLAASGLAPPLFQPATSQLTTELVGSVLASELDSIVQDAVQLALIWLQTESDDDESLPG